jgi:hypothetical protein
MCVSHSTTHRMLVQLGEDFDVDVRKWKMECESIMENSQVCLIMWRVHGCHCMGHLFLD